MWTQNKTKQEKHKHEWKSVLTRGQSVFDLQIYESHTHTGMSSRLLLSHTSIWGRAHWKTSGIVSENENKIERPYLYFSLCVLCMTGWVCSNPAMMWTCVGVNGLFGVCVCVRVHAFFLLIMFSESALHYISWRKSTTWIKKNLKNNITG